MLPRLWCRLLCRASCRRWRVSTRDFDETLSALRFPLLHRHQIRTTNLLRRLFGEGKRRTKVIPRFHSQGRGLSLVFALLVDASERWRGGQMQADIVARLDQPAVDPDSAWPDPDLATLVA